MKLIKPTEDQLNALFAVEVAGWVKSHKADIKDGTQGEKWVYVAPDSNRWATANQMTFTASMDAVLPWLEKWDNWTIACWKDDIPPNNYRCSVCKDEDCFPEWEGVAGFYADSDTPAKAAVLCLLASKGIEVEL